MVVRETGAAFAGPALVAGTLAAGAAAPDAAGAAGAGAEVCVCANATTAAHTKKKMAQKCFFTRVLNLGEY